MTVPDSVRVAHLSDPHFGTHVEAVRTALLADLHDAPPDLVILTGDITQRARNAEFRAAREFTDALPAVPRVCLPGNHDLPLFDLFTRAIRPYARFQRYVSTELEPEFTNANLAVLCVDATSRLRHKDGALQNDTIDGTAARLAGLPQPFRIIATHQPLAAVVSSDVRNVAHGARRALDRWIGAGADLFLGGHIHLPYCVPVQTSDHGASGVLAQAGTCVSRRTRGGIPNSYNLITLQHDQDARVMQIERRDYVPVAQRFVPRLQHIARSRHDAPRLWHLESPELLRARATAD